MKIALVTYEDKGKYPGEGSTEDARLKKYLVDKGLNVDFEIWTNTAVDWQQYKAVVLKSPWDYFYKIEAFRKWLDLVDIQKIKLLNPTAIVRWNTDKSYLLDVKQAGFAIVPTAIVQSEDFFEAAPFYEAWKTDTIIVKPVVSGGAKNTFFIPRAEVSHYETKINQLLTEESFLVQPFMFEIQTRGEWSLVFFNGEFSHCVLKVPKPGDFRVQHYFGGAIIPTTPPAPILDYAYQLVRQFAPGCLFARIDGLESNGAFRLMEMELIEPLLYLQDNEKLYKNYYQALLQLV